MSPVLSVIDSTGKDTRMLGKCKRCGNKIEWMKQIAASYEGRNGARFWNPSRIVCMDPSPNPPADGRFVLVARNPREESKKPWLGRKCQFLSESEVELAEDRGIDTYRLHSKICGDAP